MNYLKIVPILGLIAVGAAAQADLLGYWNFNNDDFTLNDGLAAANATLTTNTGTISWFAGDTQNALNGDPAGFAFCPVGNAENGHSITIEISNPDLAFGSLQVSYTTRGTSTGFTNDTWAYSTDGVVFQDLAGSNYSQNTTPWVVRSFDFTPMSTFSTAFLRLTFDGASGSSGNNRIDNLQLNGSVSAVPEPATLGSLAIGMLAIVRRRRK